MEILPTSKWQTNYLKINLNTAFFSKPFSNTHLEWVEPTTISVDRTLCDYIITKQVTNDTKTYKILRRNANKANIKAIPLCQEHLSPDISTSNLCCEILTAVHRYHKSSTLLAALFRSLLRSTHSLNLWSTFISNCHVLVFFAFNSLTKPMSQLNHETLLLTVRKRAANFVIISHILTPRQPDWRQSSKTRK